MTDTVTSRADAPPPEAQIAQVLLGQLVPRLINLFAVLKLADHLSVGPKSADELASLTGTHAPTLARVLRTLASLGFVTHSEPERFALQPLSDIAPALVHPALGQTIAELLAGLAATERVVRV